MSYVIYLFREEGVVFSYCKNKVQFFIVKRVTLHKKKLKNHFYLDILFENHQYFVFLRWYFSQVITTHCP